MIRTCLSVCPEVLKMESKTKDSWRLVGREMTPGGVMGGITDGFPWSYGSSWPAHTVHVSICEDKEGWPAMASRTWAIFPEA